VPSLRFSRDKRGYEHIYLVHVQNRRGKPSRPRVLYWYRTPPGIRVGRAPFDEEVRRRLEAQNPDVVFDWPTIIATPMPPPAENEQWRERRRAERAAKHAQRAEEGLAARSDHDTSAEPNAIEPDESTRPDDHAHISVLPTGNESKTALLDIEPQPTSDLNSPAGTGLRSSETETPSPQPPDRSQTPVGRRRRRRGGRRRHDRQELGALPNQGASDARNPVVPTDSDQGSGETVHDSETKESIESNDE
jgi:hypothetical protein